MSQNQPIAFEIEIKSHDSPNQAPAIKTKLESYSSAAPSLEDIESKLKKAEELRKQEFAKKKPIDEAITRANQRRSTVLMEQEQNFKQKLETKLETAEHLRAEAIDRKVLAAKRFSDKLENAQQKSCKIVDENKNRFEAKLEKKGQGLQKTQVLLEQKKEKAKDHGEKVMQIMHSHNQKVAKKQESIKENI